MSGAPLLRLLGIRIALAAVSLLIVSFIIFWLVEWLPGDAAQRMLGRDATGDRLANLRDALNLHLPPLQRYWIWLSEAAGGSFGTSIVADRAVSEYVGARAVNTLVLATYALAIYVPLSLILGLTSAARRGLAADHVISVLVLAGMCIPEFVSGVLLVSLFAVTLGWFPPLALIGQADGLIPLLHVLLLPALTLALAMTAYAVRMMRDNLIEVLDSAYVRLATLKGLKRWRVLVRHALPNALGPAINVTALNIAWLIGGIVVVEVVFNFPGVGRLLVDSIALKDVPVVLAVSMLLTGLYILVNLIADLLVILLNPRLRTAM